MATDRLSDFKLGMGDEIIALHWCGIKWPQVAMHSQLPRFFSIDEALAISKSTQLFLLPP